MISPYMRSAHSGANAAEPMMLFRIEAAHDGGGIILVGHLPSPSPGRQTITGGLPREPQ